MAEETLSPASVRGVLGQFQSFFQSLNVARKVAMFSVLAVVLVGMAALVYLANRETWTPLYNNITNEDAAVVKEKLDKAQIPVQIGPGGRSILVPTGRADEARLALAREHVSLGGGLGFADLFIGQSSLGETEFQQQVKYRMALEGELSRLVAKINNIRSAKVTLALPKKTVFLDQEQKPTASVVVDMAPGTQLGRNEVLTVVHLVANSVEGLQKEGVVVVDNQGHLLSRGISDEASGVNFSDHYAFRRSVEQALESKVVSQLESVVGENRVQARVAADLDFDKTKLKQEIYDPDASVVRSEQISSESSAGTRSIPVGVPGVTSNLPETQAGASEVANVSQLQRSTETRNYENSLKTVLSEPSLGKLKRLTVSVLIDGKYKPILDASGRTVTRQYEEWTTAEKQEIEKLIKAAVGFDDKRGDSLEVVNLRFTRGSEEDVSRQVEATQRNREFFLDILRYTFLGVGLLALILFVIRPMVQRLSAKPEDLDLLMGLPATIGELEGEELEIPTEKEVGIPPKEKILEIARQDPLATANTIRSWLKEKSR
jgi:flagellar M-ring protein FliF